MRQFMFPQGRVWVLHDGPELMVADLEEGGTALLLFSDEDLAATYAVKSGLLSKKAKAIETDGLIGFLRQSLSLGVTHVVIDHTAGRPGATSTIQKAIQDVQTSTE
jgi:hypothetical protein